MILLFAMIDFFCSFFFFKQKTAYEMRISDWSSDVCSSDLLIEDGNVERSATGGWIGITDKYWLTALVPTQGEAWNYTFRHASPGQGDRYQVDYLGEAKSVAAGQAATVESRMFAGAKLVKLLEIGRAHV